MNTYRPHLFTLVTCLVLFIGLLVGLGIGVGSTQASDGPRQANPILSGRVYEGNTGVEPPVSSPLAGVTVRLNLIP